MRIAQDTDGRLMELKSILRGLAQLSARKRKKYNHYTLIDDVVHRKTYFSELESWAVVVPLDLRSAIIKLFHDKPVSGHGGSGKTYYKIRSKYYFSNMIRFITRYVKDCLIC